MYIHKEKLLIHYFHINLSESVARWYVQLNFVHIQPYRDLMRVFLAQYKHVMDTTLDRPSL